MGRTITMENFKCISSFDWSFLDRARVRARIAATRADGEALLAQYQQSVLLALEDVENALASYARSQERDVQLRLAATDTIVNGQPISQVFVLRMELPAYWTCWTRRECNCRPKTLMRKAIPITRSSPFYCTNRLPAGGRNILLRLRKAEDPEAYPPGICVVDIECTNV